MTLKISSKSEDDRRRVRNIYLEIHCSEIAALRRSRNRFLFRRQARDVLETDLILWLQRKGYCSSVDEASGILQELIDERYLIPGAYSIPTRYRLVENRLSGLDEGDPGKPETGVIKQSRRLSKSGRIFHSFEGGESLEKAIGGIDARVSTQCMRHALSFPSPSGVRGGSILNRSESPSGSEDDNHGQSNLTSSAHVSNGTSRPTFMVGSCSVDAGVDSLTDQFATKDPLRRDREFFLSMRRLSHSHLPRVSRLDSSDSHGSNDEHRDVVNEREAFSTNRSLSSSGYLRGLIPVSGVETVVSPMRRWKEIRENTRMNRSSKSVKDHLESYRIAREDPSNRGQETPQAGTPTIQFRSSAELWVIDIDNNEPVEKLFIPLRAVTSGKQYKIEKEFDPTLFNFVDEVDYDNEFSNPSSGRDLLV
mmetsp:Transcript_3192/g.6030  ORF Transcript_3192/g.6030 Transcript_3192/m.6030 type:complete len:421 (-) Transcript_3192:1688-2950(-)